MMLRIDLQLQKNESLACVGDRDTERPEGPKEAHAEAQRGDGNVV